jgi:membrane-associated phospholipid phosphatase
MRSHRFQIGLTLLYAVMFGAIYGGTNWLSARRDPPTAPHFAFETAIPFVPAMAWFYLSVPLMLCAGPLIMRTKRELLPFFFTLTAQLVVAGLAHLIFPFSPAWPPSAVEGLGTQAFQVADALNLDYNMVPSLHVSFATTVALVFGRRAGPIGRLLLWTWFLAAAASTLLLHQHHLLDVATGAALGILTVVIVQRRTERRDFLEALQIETLCVRELVLFARRHRRYLLTGLAIWGYSLRRWRQTRLLRAGFCLAQHIDDVLDGDRRVQGDPVAYVRGLLDGEPGPLVALSGFVIAELKRRDGHEKLDALVEVLIEDRRRMDARKTMPAAALATHHHKTFSLSLDLTLIAIGSDLRAEDAPDLIDALSWCSPIRDLDEDLAKGLINIPEEVLARVPGPVGPRTLLAAEPIKAWLREEHRRGVESLAAGPSPSRRTGARSDDPGWAVLSSFHRALAAYEKKYRRRHVDFVYAR